MSFLCVQKARLPGLLILHSGAILQACIHVLLRNELAPFEACFRKVRSQPELEDSKDLAVKCGFSHSHVTSHPQHSSYPAPANQLCSQAGLLH